MRRNIHYVVAVLLVLIVTSLTVLSTVLPAAVSVILNENVLVVLYALLSLAIAIVTFGVIGDSKALVHVKGTMGAAVRVGGSAAGFVIFFYLLSSGLATYRDLEVVLRDPTRGLPLSQGDGRVEVRLDTDFIAQIFNTEDGRARFRVPRSAEYLALSVKGVTGKKWAVKGYEPNSCVTADGQVNRACRVVRILLARDKVCFTDMQMGVDWSGSEEATLPAQLRFVLKRLASPGVEAEFWHDFSQEVRDRKIYEQKFTIPTGSSAGQGICPHLRYLVTANFSDH